MPVYFKISNSVKAYFNLALILAITGVAVPLSAQVQSTTLVPDINVVVNGDTIVVNVEVPPPDSAQVARDEAALRAMEAIAEYLENCDCADRGSSNVTVVANAALTVAAFLIVWRLGQIANKEHPDHPSHPDPLPHPNHPDHPDKSSKSNKS